MSRLLAMRGAFTLYVFSLAVYSASDPDVTHPDVGPACDPPWMAPTALTRSEIRQNRRLLMEGCQTLNGSPDCYECDSTYWREVPTDLLPDNLCYLRIVGSGAFRFGSQSFVNKSIVALEIVQQGLLSFHIDTFSGMRFIDSLRIGESQWHYFDSANHSFFHLFRDLDSLTSLKLEGNGLSLKGVDVEAKSNATILPNLNYLSLRDNKLERIEKDLFWELRESPVLDLNLHSSSLERIEELALRNLPSLQHLDVYGNSGLIWNINSKLPLALSSVNDSNFMSLGLGKTGLVSLPYKITEPVKTNLRVLDLAHNKLTSLGNTGGKLHLPDMANLEKLFLQSNMINAVESSTFDCCPNVKELNVSDNKLRGMLKGFILPSLVKLDYSYQCRYRPLQIDECENDAFIFNEGLFVNSSKLEELRFTGINCSRFPIENDTFIGLTSLKKLYLDDSTIQTLPANGFRTLTNLTYLNLSQNPNLHALTVDTFNGLTSLMTLDLSYSSRALNDETIKLRREAPDEYLKQALELPSLKTLLLKCALTVNCKKPVSFESPFQSGLLSQFPQLEILDLSYNSLGPWSQKDVFKDNPKLKALLLAGSQFITLTTQMVDSFERLQLLDFQFTPVMCDSGVKKFYHMAKRKKDSLEIVGWRDGNGYFCNQPANVQASISYREWVEQEELTDEELGLIIIGAIVGAVMIVGALALVYSKRYMLAYRLLKRNNVSNQRDPNFVYDYDVFICYTNDTKQWVNDELVPRLEEPNNSGIRACIHERDFKVGWVIKANITESIDKSRKFLLILSPGIAESDWCQFEINVAYDQFNLFHSDFLSQKDSSFIVVYKEDLAHVQLNKRLKEIVDRRTYLRYPNNDPNQVDKFYSKLNKSISLGKSAI